VKDQKENGKKMMLYLDMCVYNRPFDDQSQSESFEFCHFEER